MKNIEILLQGESIPDIQLVRLDQDTTVKDLIAVTAKYRKCEHSGDFLVFAEDSDDPLAPDDMLPKGSVGQPVKLHVHRCCQIKLIVSFNGTAKEHNFGSSKTVATVKTWMAVKVFGMSQSDAAEHVLQITGTTDRPEPDTHIGSLATHSRCRLEFDLVPHKRVEG